MRVIAIPEVRAYLKKLPQVLYEKEYFGFEEQAVKYAAELFEDIKVNLPIKSRKPAPPYFDRYGKGMEYAAFKKNRHTTWYVFFTTYEENGGLTYLVRYIGNNHTIAQYL